MTDGCLLRGWSFSFRKILSGPEKLTPDPREHVWVTEAHLSPQVVKDAHNYSKTIVVYMYGADREKTNYLVGINFTRDRLRTDDSLFNTPLANHVLLAMSY